MKQLVLASVLALGAFASSARAQLLIGNDDALAGAPNAWHVDVNTCTATPLWSGPEAWGMAADDANNVVYCNDGSTLYRWAYNSPNVPVSLGTITSSVDGVALSMTGLAFTGGKLYGVRNVSSTNNPESMYEIDPDTLLATLFVSYTPLDFDFGGLAFRPADGLFYGTNDDTTPHGSGLFSIDGTTGTITFVTAYPAGENDIDGLGVDTDMAFLIEDEPSPIHTYDLIAGTYSATPCANPHTTSEVFSSGAWAPGLVPGDCADPVTYCTGKINTQGCVPEIGWVGRPDSDGTGQFDITLTNHRVGKFAMVVYSVTGRDNVPFQGGILCIAAPTRRTPVTMTAATGNLIICPFPPNLNMDEGAASMDFNARIASGVDPALAAGQLVNAQWWARDSGSETALSNALEFEICP